MAKEKYSFALEDNLFEEYHRFMNPGSGEYDKNIIKKLLSFHIYPFIFNLAQAKRTGITLSSPVSMQLHHTRYSIASLEQLADYTEFHCVLSTTKSDFPYINIFTDKIRTSVSGTFFSTENRDKAKAHIAKLCKSADTITIHDKYLSTSEANQLTRILPTEKKLTIVIHNKNIDGYDHQAIKSTLQNACPHWQILEQELLVNSHHDRYLVIDDKTAIILTSGFSNLFSTVKDFTYIVVPIDENPLYR